jgi:two-component system vancomycin resistance associated response regulator VraR
MRVKLRIVLMDEYVVALEGLYDSLRVIPNFEIVKACTNEADLVQTLNENETDIVVCDLMLKDNKSIDLLEKINRAQHGNIKIIALVSQEYDKLLFERGMEVGVKAFLPKDTSVNDLISAIITIGKGNDIVPDQMMRDKHSQILSDMETKVLGLVVQEYTNDRIAKELYLSRRTVESYMASICNKLDVDSRIGAVREAIRLKLV